MDKIEFRAVIKFLTLKGQSPSEIETEMKIVYKDDTPSIRTIYRWYNEYKRGRQSLEDDPRSGRPSTSTGPDQVAAVERLLLEDRRIRVAQIAVDLGIAVGSVATILHEQLGYSKLSARWVPKMLTPDMKQRRVECSQVLLDRYNSQPADVERRLLTGDECWLYQYDPETKTQSMEWRCVDEPAPHKFKVQKSAGKVMGIFFWDCDGIVYREYLHKGETVTGNYYAGVLGRLHAALDQKRQAKHKRKSLLLQDNAPAHTSQVAMAAATEAGIEILDHPPYSPDLAPSDFFLFKNMKKPLRGRRFASTEEVIGAVDEWCETRPENFFRDGIREVLGRWQKCIAVRGDYVEK